MKEANKLVYHQECDVCKSGMNEGFFITGFIDEYFCKKKCLRTQYSKKAYTKMYNKGVAFWTTWYSEA